MREFQSTISKIMKDHKRNKRYVAFLVALSMIVSVAVPFSLIMPAISMTYDDETFQEDDFGDLPEDSDGLTLLSLSNTDVISMSVEEDYPNAVEIRSGNEGCIITSLYINDNNENPLSELEITGNNLSINFGLSYEFPDMKNKFVSAEDSDKRYMYVKLEKSNGLLLNPESRIGLVKDSDYYLDYIARYTELSNEERENIAAGTYEIKDDYILITLTDDYIDYLNSGTGNVKGTLTFDGTLSRSNNATNSGTINFAGQEVTVTFQEQNPSIRKGNGVVNNTNGTIHWTITVNNPGVDLSQYELTDEMFANAENITIKYGNDILHSYDNNVKVTEITFDSSWNEKTSITIEYDTPIENYNTTINNHAELKKGDGEPKSTGEGSAWVGKPFTVTKSGTPDYKADGTYTGKIKWTVTVTSNYGTVDGYVLTDNAFQKATNINVSYNSDKAGSFEHENESNTLILRNTSATSATITYETNAYDEGETVGQNDKTVTNDVTVEEPKKNTEKVSTDITYKKKSDLINFSKSCNDNDYNADTRKITWTITVTPQDQISLDGYTLTDSQFPNNVSGFVSITGQSGKNYKSEDYITVSGGDLTFKNNIRESVVIKYTTDVDLTDVNDGASTNVVNEINDNNGHSTTVTKTVTKRSTVTKTQTNSSGANSVTNNKEIQQTIDWTVNITNDGTFSGKTYTDELSVTDGAEHTITDAQINAIEVKAGKTSGEMTKLTSGYQVKKTDKGFTVTFDSSLDTAGYNYVEIKYSTTATIPADADFGEYHFNNTGSGFGNGTGEIGYKITKDNPQKEETLNLTIKKSWQDNDTSVRPGKVKVKLLYNTKTGDKNKNDYDNAEWTQYGDIITLKSNNSDTWTELLSNLTKSKTEADPDTGGSKPTVYYFYKVVEVTTDSEIEINNYFTVKNNDGTEKGIYEVTNSGETNQYNDSQTLEIQNKYHEKNSTITANKNWYNDSDEKYSKYRPSEIIVALQKKENGEWRTVTDKGEKRLNSDNGWNCSFDNLESYTTADGTVKMYEYRVVEIGYKYNGQDYPLPESTWGSPKFTTDAAQGYYTGSYNPTQLSDSGTIQITNTFTPVGSITITPQKKWVGDSGDLSSNRPTSITLKLKQKLGNNGTWEDVKDASGNSISPIELTTANNVSNEWDTDVTWQGNEIENLPQQEITINEDGTIKKQNYSYRFVEVVDGKELAEGDSFEKSGGSYQITSTEISNNGTLTITNTFKENVGISKSMLDKSGKKLPSSIDKEDFYEWIKKGKLVKRELEDENGNKDNYYIFNWEILFTGSEKLTLNDVIKPIVDKLPDGFTLCLEDNPENPKDSVGAKNSSELLSVINDEYFKNPYYVFSTWASMKILDVHDIMVNNWLHSPQLPSEKTSGYKNTEEDYWNYIFDSKTDVYYYYDTKENKVAFSKPDLSCLCSICYSTKIKCADLDEMIENGTYTIQNSAVLYENDGTPDKNDVTDSASLTIVNKAPSNLITKDYKSQGIPGYIGFSLDVNPDGKNLSNGDTIDIEDIFKTDSYLDKDKNNQLTEGENLVDVLMNSIRLYKVDANGNKTLLDKSKYTLKFESNENGVTNRENNETGAALLKLTIPDETHIVIDYVYKLIANNKTPSVKNGCKSSDRDEKGKFLIMAPGMVPPAGDEITFTNKAKLYSDSASADDSVNEKKYQISKSSGTISTNRLPKIKKVNVGNYGIDTLSAKFLLAKYDQNNKKWVYATEIDDSSKKITAWTDGVTGKKVADNASLIDVDTSYSYEISLNKDCLYKLIEVEVPDDYEGSNLGLDSDKAQYNAKFKSLIVNYLNTGETKLDDKDYAVFLNNYVSTYYFVYNSVMTSYPDDIDPEKVIQVKSGENVEIPNNQLIDIDVTKNWNDGNESKKNDEVEVTLYWSHTKSSTGMPIDAEIATRDALGLMDANFNAVKKVKTGTTKNVWTDLPNGKDGKPIYYYIKETSYTIGDKTYELDKESGVYKNGTESGNYLPTYVGNAANTDSEITITNSQQLMLKKEWKNASNYPLSASKILVNEIIVDIYGITALGAEDKILEGIVIPKGDDDKWELDITAKLNEWKEANQDKNLSDYKSFRADESKTPGFNTDDYVVSCVFNLNQNTGEITITNKSKSATEASVTVNKVWSDGEAMHKSDKITVTLYQSTQEIQNVANLTQEGLEDALTKDTEKVKVMKKMSNDDKQIYENVELSAENDWTYTWTGLPLDDGAENNAASYYYYVLENMERVQNSDKYTATYTPIKSGAKTTYTVNNTRKAIVVQKQWYDENGEPIIDIYDEDGETKENNTGSFDDIELKVYKQNSVKPANGLNIVAVGDSITKATSYSVSEEDSYPIKLKSKLAKTYQTVNVVKSCEDGQHINDLKSSYISSISSNTDIVCLLAGTNDIHHSKSQSGLSCNESNYLKTNGFDTLKETTKSEIATKMQGLIDEIQGKNSDVKIFIGTIPYFVWMKEDGTTMGASNWWWCRNEYSTQKEYETACKALVDAANEAITEIANADDNICLVDVCGTLLNNTTELADSSLYFDGCHLNANGCEKVANAYYTAINNYYTTKDYLDDTVILNQANNWTAVVDVPDDGDEYYIEEVNVPTGWNVTYSGQGLKPGTATPIIAKNTKQPVSKTEISVVKKWEGDNAETDASRRNNISLALMCSVDGTNWEEVAVDMPEPTPSEEDEDTWTYVYTNLPVTDNAGRTYSYKVEEAELEGYKATYGTPDSVTAVKGNSGTLTITNTRLLSLKLKKTWVGVDNPQGDVTVNIYRSTNPNDVPKENVDLILQVPSAVSVGVGKDLPVSANKTINSAKSDDENIATVSVSGQTIKIHGVAEGTATITVKDENGDTATIQVTVSALEVLLNGSSTLEIEVDTTGALSAKVGEDIIENVTFSSDDASILSINGSEITAKALGETTITATYVNAEGVNISVKHKVVVKLPEKFEIISENGNKVEIDGKLRLSVDKNFGTFKWESLDPTIATVNESTGEVTGVSVGAIVITATRNDGETAEYEVTVVKGFKPISLTANTEISMQEIGVATNRITSFAITFGDMVMSNQYNSYFEVELYNGTSRVGYVLINLANPGTADYGANNYYNYNYNNKQLTFTLMDEKVAQDIDKVKVNFTNISSITITSIDTTSSASRIRSFQNVVTNYALAENTTDNTPLKGEFVTSVDITATPDGAGSWETVVENLDVYGLDAEGNKVSYYYWVVESKEGFTASYLFEDADDQTTHCINAAQPGDGAITIRNTKVESHEISMPSTGGPGVERSHTVGIILMCGSTASYILARRRRNRRKRA